MKILFAACLFYSIQAHAEDEGLTSQVTSYFKKWGAEVKTTINDEVIDRIAPKDDDYTERVERLKSEVQALESQLETTQNELETTKQQLAIVTTKLTKTEVELSEKVEKWGDLDEKERMLDKRQLELQEDQEALQQEEEWINNQKLLLTDPGRSTLAPKQKLDTASCKLPGKVIKIADGDTLTVLDTEKKQHIIRLAGIDTPEIGQPYGQAAKKFLSGKVFKKDVCIDWYKKDKYRRLVGVVRLNGEDINLELVKAGYAWHFKKYQEEQTPKNRVLYADAHEKSRSDVIGLWQEPDPIEPDAWRAGKRPKKEKIPVKAVIQNTSTTFSCGSKRFCKHMDSCSEACFYLTQCGLGRLDRDKDGIPCESICGGRCE